MQDKTRDKILIYFPATLNFHSEHYGGSGGFDWQAKRLFREPRNGQLHWESIEWTSL